MCYYPHFNLQVITWKVTNILSMICLLKSYSCLHAVPEWASFSPKQVLETCLGGTVTCCPGPQVGPSADRECLKLKMPVWCTGFKTSQRIRTSYLSTPFHSLSHVCLFWFLPLLISSQLSCLTMCSRRNGMCKMSWQTQRGLWYECKTETWWTGLRLIESVFKRY